MAKLDYTTDDRLDERLNPVEQSKSSSLNAREQAALDQIESGLRDGATADSTQEDKNIDNLREREQGTNGDQGEDSGRWSTDVKPGPVSSNSRIGKIKSLLSGKKSGIAVITLFLSAVTGMMGFAGPSAMLASMSLNLTIGNDSSSVVMQRRAMKVFSNIINPDSICVGKIDCVNNTPSNTALKRMARRGVVAADSSGTPIEIGEKGGFPSSKPERYRVDMGDGTHRVVDAREWDSFIMDKKHRKIAWKIYGTRGLLSKYASWNSKHLTKKFFSKFPGINRMGGIANNLKGSLKDRMAAIREKHPKIGEISDAATTAKTKIEKHSKKARRGGVGYLVLVTSCLAVKAPKIAAAGVAAVQIAQILPIVNNYLLSPGSKQMAAGEGSELTDEEMEAAGTVLTERGVSEGYADERPLAVLDSIYTLSLLGVNKSKVPIPKDYVPAYSIINDPLSKALTGIDEATSSACNLLLSPTVMYSMAAMDATVTAAAATSVIGGIIKVAAGWAIGEIISTGLQSLVQAGFQKLIEDIAENDMVGSARYKALGDVLGVSALLFFGGAAMGRHIPVMKRTQVKAFNNMKRETEEFQREMDIAALSPFDTSSQYTFLGSMLHNLRIGMISRSVYTDSLFSTLMGVFKIPALAVSTSGSITYAADNYSENFCDYASEYDLETVAADGTDMTPAVSFAGIGCMGPTEVQDEMSTADPISLATGEGWINESVDIEPDDDIDKLNEKGYFEKDTQVTDFIEECSDISSGDYIYNTPSCMVVEDGAAGDVISPRTGEVPGTDIDTAVLAGATDYDGVADAPPPLNDPLSLQAIGPLLWDQQVRLSINGFDEDITGAGDENATGSTGEFNDVDPEGWSLPVATGEGKVTSEYSNRINPITQTAELHNGLDIGGAMNTHIYAVRAGTATCNVIGTTGWDGYGNAVSIDHGDVSGIGQLLTFYAHLERCAFDGTKEVQSGELIGYMGTTGMSTGVHLHFTMIVGTTDHLSSNSVDPRTLHPGLASY